MTKKVNRVKMATGPVPIVHLIDNKQLTTNQLIRLSGRCKTTVVARLREGATTLTKIKNRKKH